MLSLFQDAAALTSQLTDAPILESSRKINVNDMCIDERPEYTTGESPQGKATAKRYNHSTIGYAGLPKLKIKTPKLKELQTRLQEQHSQQKFEKTIKQAPSEDLRNEFESKLMKRREMIYREYNLDKLWQDTSKLVLKNCMDFADTDLESDKLKFKDWVDDQVKLKQWKQVIDRQSHNKTRTRETQKPILGHKRAETELQYSHQANGQESVLQNKTLSLMSFQSEFGNNRKADLAQVHNTMYLFPNLSNGPTKVQIKNPQMSSIYTSDTTQTSQHRMVKFKWDSQISAINQQEFQNTYLNQRGRNYF